MWSFFQLPFPLCMKSMSYVFYLATTGWIFYISLLCDKFSQWSQGRKTSFGGKERTGYSLSITKRKRKWYKKYSEKSTSSNKQK